MSDPSDWSWWTGGDATKNLNPQGQYGQQLGGQLQGYLGGAAHNPLNFGQANQDRQNMGNLAGMLQGVASGQNRGAGELAVNRQVGQATAAQQAAAQMAHGANAAMAARNAARNTADIGVAGAGQAAMAQMGDQAAARGQLAGVYGQMQGGDLQQQQLGLQQYGQQHQAQQGYLQQLLGLNQQGFQNQAAINTLGMNDHGMFPYFLQQMGSNAAAGASMAGKGG